MCSERVRVLPASPAEVAAIVQLVNQAYRPTAAGGGWTHEAALISGSRTDAKQVNGLMALPDSIVFIGLQGLAVAACVHIEKNADDCRIGLLAVDPAQQGAGIGKQLLAHAENYARSHWDTKTFSMVVLSARSELIAFYERRGYQKTGDVRDYPLSAGAGIPKRLGVKVEVLAKQAASA